MRILFITRKNICYVFIAIFLFISCFTYYSFAKDTKNIQFPYFEQQDIYTSKEKIAYLTFDDGPNSTITPKVLEILDRTNIKANFFVIGKHVDKYPEIAEQIYSNGHFIGNHGYSHDNSILYKSKESFIDEIKKTDEAIGNAIGISDYCSHVFRCPNGSMSNINYAQKQKCLKYLPGIDYTFVDWNVLNNDSMQKYSSLQLLNNLKESASDKGSMIILMHDSGDVNKTYDVLEDSINYLKEQGYEFRTFYDFITK